MGNLLDALIKEKNKGSKYTLLSKGLSDYADYERIPFTSPKLNYMTYGGLPLGTIVEFFGLESSGKTTTALDVVKNAQQVFNGTRDVVFVDVENSFKKSWAETLGVDTDNLIVMSPKEESAEVILTDILDIIDTGEVGLVVLDSIAALLSDAEFEDGLDKQHYGGISKVLTTFSKQASLSCAKNKCLLLCINQCRDNIGSMYGGLITPGGHGFKYMCTLRALFQHGKFIDEKGNELSNNAENPFGNIINVKLEKTKCCAPDRRLGHYTLRYDTGIDFVSDLCDVCELYGFIYKAGAWYSIVNTETGEVLTLNDEVMKFQGKAKLVTTLNNNPELLNYLKSELDKSML